MSLSQWTAIGNISLVVLIVFTVLMLAVMFYRKVWYWFAVFTGIAGCVVTGEIVSFGALHKSISSQYGYWIQAEPVWALLALGCFLVAMLALIVHLYAFGKTRKKPDA